MRKTIVRCIGIATFVAPLIVFAHGEEAGMMGLGTMGEMMTLMHEHMDENTSTDCGSINDEMMMERGEEMMEEMMGTEDHERIEEAMEVDMRDHDTMHTMMGMVATGCLGDEVAGSIGQRYGLGVTSTSRTGNGGVLAIGLVGGAALGFLGAGFFKKKPAAVTAPPTAPPA